MSAIELSTLIERVPTWGLVGLVGINLLVMLTGTARTVYHGGRGVLAAGRWYGRARKRRLDRLALERVRQMPWGETSRAMVQGWTPPVTPNVGG